MAATRAFGSCHDENVAPIDPAGVRIAGHLDRLGDPPSAVERPDHEPECQRVALVVQHGRSADDPVADHGEDELPRIQPDPAGHPEGPTSSSVRSSDRLRENGWPISHAGSRSSEVGAGVAGSVVAGEAVEAVAVTRTLGAGEGEAAGSSLGSAGAAHAAARTATRHTRHAAVITPWSRAYSRDVARRRTAVIGSEGSANRIQG